VAAAAQIGRPWAPRAPRGRPRGPGGPRGGEAEEANGGRPGGLPRGPPARRGTGARRLETPAPAWCPGRGGRGRARRPAAARILAAPARAWPCGRGAVPPGRPGTPGRIAPGLAAEGAGVKPHAPKDPAVRLWARGGSGVRPTGAGVCEMAGGPPWQPPSCARGRQKNCHGVRAIAALLALVSCAPHTPQTGGQKLPVRCQSAVGLLRVLCCASARRGTCATWLRGKDGQGFPGDSCAGAQAGCPQARQCGAFQHASPSNGRFWAAVARRCRARFGPGAGAGTAKGHQVRGVRFPIPQRHACQGAP